MNSDKNLEPIPAWLASKVRHAQLLAALSWSWPTAAVVILLTGVELLWWSGSAESMFVPLFWNAVFLLILYFVGRELYRAVRVFFRPDRSEEVVYLRRLGALEEVVGQIQDELRTLTQFNYGQDVTFTKNWLVISNGYRFSVRRLDELVWVFKKETTLKLNWILPIWRTHSVVFRSVAGPDAESKCSKEWGQKLIAHTQEHCPGIIVGFSEEMDKAWESDRALFIAAAQEPKG